MNTPTEPEKLEREDPAPILVPPDDDPRELSEERPETRPAPRPSRSA